MKKPHKPHKYRNEIIAWANGAVIQYEYAKGDWITVDLPVWQPGVEYRVKPEALYYRIARFKDEDSEWLVPTTDAVDGTEGLEQATGFKEWVTDWIEVELEEQKP